MIRDAARWAEILIALGVRAQTAHAWAPVFSAEIGPGTFSAGDVELDDFLGQVLHESGMLERTEEGLNYTSAERIRAVWPSRFQTLDHAEPFVRNAAALANKVYGGRMGNDRPGDGFMYRGRGLIQVTGKANYALVGDALGIDLVQSPDLLAHRDIALKSAIAWWEKRIPDGAMGDVVRVTKLVNGGTVGLAHRQELTEEAREALG